MGVFFGYGPACGDGKRTETALDANMKADIVMKFHVVKGILSTSVYHVTSKPHRNKVVIKEKFE